MLLFLEVVVGVFEILRSMLTSISVNSRNKSFFLGVHFLLVFLRVVRDVCLIFELFLDSAEFYSTLVCSLKEQLFGIRECVDHF